jgi:hypothetical protein
MWHRAGAGHRGVMLAIWLPKPLMSISTALRWREAAEAALAGDAARRGRNTSQSPWYCIPNDTAIHQAQAARQAPACCWN